MEVRAKNPFCLDVSRKLNSNLERIRNNAVFTVSQNYLCSTLNGVCVCVCVWRLSDVSSVLQNGCGKTAYSDRW